MSMKCMWRGFAESLTSVLMLLYFTILLLGSVAGHQLQQNQLVLSLNQSYFQLVSNQNALIDRFNRLEQMVLGGTSASSNVMMEAYGQHLGPPCDDVVHSTPGYSLFTGAQSPFNLNNCELFTSAQLQPTRFCFWSRYRNGDSYHRMY